MNNNGHIYIYTGLLINPLDPDPDGISIEDICHSLSLQCRFTGHTRQFYSTGQHSVLVSRACPNFPMVGLLHDASEAYMSDLARPIKKTDWGKNYMEAESRLMECIFDKFDLPWPMPEEVHEADNMLLNTEIRDLMPKGLWKSINPDSGAEVAPYRIKSWFPTFAQDMFMSEYNWLLKKEEVGKLYETN